MISNRLSSGAIKRSSRSKTTLAPLRRAAFTAAATRSSHAARQITSASAAVISPIRAAISSTPIHEVRAPSDSAAVAWRATR